MSNEDSSRNDNDVRTWLSAQLGSRCSIAPEKIDLDTPFDEYGVDSLMAVSLTGDIRDRFGVNIGPTALFEFNTVNLLAEYLNGLSGSIHSQQASTV